MILPNCRLFLVTPRQGGAAELACVLEAGLKAGDVASLLLTARTNEEETRKLARALKPIAHAHDVALMIEEDAELAAGIGADGVELRGDAKDIATARRILGPERAVGMVCEANRHLAMESGEAGADYVVLDQEALIEEDEESLIAWWSVVFEVPCVAARPVQLEHVAATAAQGPDFIRPAEDIWITPEAAAKFVSEANRIMKEVAK